MTWIKTTTPAEDSRLIEVLEAQRKLYPKEYGPPTPGNENRAADAPGVGRD
jgi:hypothetical protein